MEADKWLVVGLGNPGEEYELSPHNMGFQVMDRLAQRNSIRITRPDSMALTGVGAVGGAPVILAKPQTFMNLSGGSVRLLMQKHEIPLSRLLVVYDDLDLPWSSVRIRTKGSPATHNGMKSVVSSLSTQEFPRLRLGVHPGRRLASGQDYLLSPLPKAQRTDLDSLLDYASEAVESILADGVEKAMTKYNRRAEGLSQEEE